MADLKLNLEKNFLSAVVYLHNEQEKVVPFFEALHNTLENRFEQYEIIAVDDRCTDSTIEQLRNWAKKLEKPLTILHMSIYQGLETAMNAGLECAIGDFVLECDAILPNFDMNLINKIYDTSLLGNDIVNLCPEKQHGKSKAFYSLFNKFSRSAYPLRSDVMRIISRRAINRVHAISKNLPYRKAAYAASGLKVANVAYKGMAPTHKDANFNLAIDSLVLYTDAGYQLSLGAALFMILLTVFELAYTILIFVAGKPIEGWTTLMFVMTVGFVGVFGLFAVALKYLSLILRISSRKEICLIEGIEKIQK